MKVIQSWSHPTLEIGFLEIGEALGAEMNEEQLYSSPSVKGYLHIVGHPTCRNEVNERLKEIALVKSGFG